MAKTPAKKPFPGAAAPFKKGGGKAKPASKPAPKK